jgi:transcriptional regulator with XRE-family HTH domain
LNDVITSKTKRVQINELLKKLRNELGLTQNELAEMMGWTEKHHSHVENGRKLSPFAKLYRRCWWVNYIGSVLNLIEKCFYFFNNFNINLATTSTWLELMN